MEACDLSIEVPVWMQAGMRKFTGISMILAGTLQYACSTAETGASETPALQWA